MVYRSIVSTCIDCSTKFNESARGQRTKRCNPCGLHWHQYKLHGTGRYASNLKMVSAIKRGVLKRATDFACADCAKPAQCYDHRDYSKPLDVVPVCFTCNIKRGPALPIRPFTSLLQMDAA